MRAPPRHAGPGLAVLAACAALAAPAAAQRSLDFHRLHTEILVRPDGSMAVTETITVQFIGSWNGVLRRIPIEYETEHGANYTLRLDVTGATDDAGTELRVDEDREGRYRAVRIWVPGAEDAVRTVVLRYDVANGLRFFDEHDELYWNVTGDEGEFPIRSASANVHLPEGADGIRTTAYTGPYGSAATDAGIDVQGRMISYRASRPLGFREGLTIVAGWNPGVVERPTAGERARDFILANLPLLFPFAALALMLAVWRRHGRDPARLSIAPQYEPPAGVSPAEAGTLMDGSPDMRDITATIVDLAVRGYLTVEETSEERLFGLFSTKGFAFAMQRPQAEWAELKAHERKLLDALFDGGSRTRIETEDLENEFYKDLPDIKKELSGTLVRGGHYPKHPNTVRAIWVFAGLAAGFIVAFGGAAFVAGFLGQQPVSAIVGGVLTGLVVIGVGLFMPRRTVKGARTHEALLGFEEFLRRVEKDRFERVIRTPELFEKYLPFAMAFGVEKNWALAFDDIYREPPDWYRGGRFDAFHAHAFAGNLNRMAGVTATAMASAPRSSSGSSGFGGGGGGGFSGGGFGGGSSGGF